MTRDVKSIHADMPLDEVKKILLTENRGGLPVLNQKEEAGGDDHQAISHRLPCKNQMNLQRIADKLGITLKKLESLQENIIRRSSWPEPRLQSLKRPLLDRGRHGHLRQR